MIRAIICLIIGHSYTLLSHWRKGNKVKALYVCNSCHKWQFNTYIITQDGAQKEQP